MGYDVYALPSVYVRVSRHNDERDREDDEAAARLQDEIDLLIDSDPDYRRVAGDDR